MEFVLIDKKLDPGGVLAFHDLWMPSIQTVIRFVLTNRAYKICHALLENRPKPSVRQRCKEFVGQSLSKIPGARRVLRPEVLVPWSTFRAQNLILLQKISDDQRDWRFHREF